MVYYRCVDLTRESVAPNALNRAVIVAASGAGNRGAVGDDSGNRDRRDVPSEIFALRVANADHRSVRIDIDALVEATAAIGAALAANGA